MNNNLQENIQSLVPLIKDTAKQILERDLCCQTLVVDCVILESLDFVVKIKRSYSKTEEMMRGRKKPELAAEIGLMINQACKNRLFLCLRNRFDLTVADVLLLPSVAPAQFALFCMIKQKPSAPCLQPLDQSLLEVFER